MRYELSQEGNELDDDEDIEDTDTTVVTTHRIENRGNHFQPRKPLQPNELSSLLPREARDSLIIASHSGDSRLLESTISRIKAKYPKYFKLVS